MISAPVPLLRNITAFTLLTGMATMARAQHQLLVMDDNKPEVVVAARDVWPQVMEDGKLRMIRANRFALAERGDYLPFYVAVRNAYAKTSGLRMRAGAGVVNREFHFRCDLETAYSLENVFMVLMVKNDRGQDGVFICEVGRLEPRDPRPVELAVQTTLDPASFKYQLYLFSGGREVFQSRIPAEVMAAALNRMVADKIRDVRDAPPQPFVGPQPEYPHALFRKKVAGSATISFTLDDRGVVSDPAVAAATQPDFGEAAMAVIKDWRFLPKVTDGHPVASKAEMPFDFGPPK